MRCEQALGELDPLLVGEPPVALGGELLARRRQSRHERRRLEHELLEAQRLAVAVGEPLVQLGGVRRQEAIAGAVERVGDRLGGGPLGFRAARRLGQRRDQVAARG